MSGAGKPEFQSGLNFAKQGVRSPVGRPVHSGQVCRTNVRGVGKASYKQERKDCRILKIV
jgi:hypothetical protein